MGTHFFLRMCLLVAIVNGYVTSSPEGLFDGGVYRRTSGRTRAIHWPSAGPVPLQKEIELFTSGTLVRRGEFGRLAGSRALEVELECDELGLSFRQATSIRDQLLLGKLMKGVRKLRREGNLRTITEQFERQRVPLLKIAEQYDLPPVSIFRAIMASRVLGANPQFSGSDRRRPAGRRVVQSIISETSQDNVKLFLSEWELTELRTAKEHDVVGHRCNSTSARDWEQAIYAFLHNQGVSFISEDSLKTPGHGTRGTPDCVLVDDLFINGRAIKWIEFKSYYASGLRDNAHFTKRAVSRQVERYQKEFGEQGAMILKDGFSDRVSQKYPSMLFLDGGPLVSHDQFSRLWG